MQYHLDTIPVWEAMEQNTACPLCALYRRVEASEIERSLGGSVMEPDARIRVNEKGICARHHGQLFAMQNRLGHALLVDSHTKELLKKLEGLEKRAASCEKRGLFGGGLVRFQLLLEGFGGGDGLEGVARELEDMCHTCVICGDIQSHMERYFYTFLHLWKTDAAFREKWQASRGVCLPHAADLLFRAQKHLSGSARRDFATSLLSLVKANLVQDEKDLEWFTLKFDYRNQQKPWGNSRDALERTVNRLRGFCVGGGETQE